MFEFTPQGYKEAVKFLKETNQYHLIEKELSLDGYTVVNLANSLKHNSDGGALGFDRAKSNRMDSTVM